MPNSFKSDAHIGIVILNFNGLEDTLSCLKSVFEINYSSFEVIVVDNGSLQNPVSQIKKNFPKTILIENSQNLGFAEGCNTGIKKALQDNCDFILLLNNDTTVSPNLLKAFMKASQVKPKSGILGAKILRYHSQDTIDHYGGVWSKEKAEFLSLGADDSLKDPKWQEMLNVDYVCGCCLFFRKEVIEQIGFLEKKFFLLWEEADFCFRAKRKGFEIWTAPDALVWHKISQSFSGGKIHSQYFWWRNRLYWIERNCKKKEKLALYFKVLIPEIFHIFKLFFLKSLQLIILKTLKPRSLKTEKVFKLLRYKAGCKGILDYFLKNFGPCPAWVTDPKKSRFYHFFINS